MFVDVVYPSGKCFDRAVRLVGGGVVDGLVSFSIFLVSDFESCGGGKGDKGVVWKGGIEVLHVVP